MLKLFLLASLPVDDIFKLSAAGDPAQPLKTSIALINSAAKASATAFGAGVEW